MKFQMFLVKLLVLGALFIISNNNLHLLVPIEREVFFNLYSGWLGGLFNQGIEVTAYVVEFDWLPKIVLSFIN